MKVSHPWPFMLICHALATIKRRLYWQVNSHPLTDSICCVLLLLCLLEWYEGTSAVDEECNRHYPGMPLHPLLHSCSAGDGPIPSDQE